MHGVNDDLGAAISAVFDATSATMPEFVATDVPIAHLRRSSPACPSLEFSKDYLESITPMKIQSLLLFGGANLASRRNSLQTDAEPHSNCFANQRSLHQFGAEMVLVFPLRHCANENYQGECILSFELPRFLER